MFRPKKARLVDTTDPIITANYHALLADDVDILFVGENVAGQKVIGSSVEYDKRWHADRYFHVIVTDQEMSNYRSGATSYREILEAARPLYVVDRSSTGCRVYSYLLSEIPEEYYPTRDTYFRPEWAE